MKNKAHQYRMNTSSGWVTWTTKHIGGIWRWTAVNAAGEEHDGIAGNETQAQTAAKTWLGVLGTKVQP